jgi:hypothetical protein
MKAVQIHPLDDMAIALVGLDKDSQIEVGK